LLVIYLDIFCEHKKLINYSYQDVQNNVFKLKEKEKDLITDRLKFLTDEEREADTILKINKLGVWSKGLQKGLTQYTKDNFDEDREFRNEMSVIEKQIREKNVNMDEGNLNIMIDDFLEEEATNALIEKEEYDMSGQGDDYFNNYENEGEYENDD
jgi:hypothetical protein